MTRKFTALLTASILGVAFVLANAIPAVAATAPGKITFLAATCPASSSLYQRVVAGQDPYSNENGNAADPADITAYGCARTSGLGFFLLANSTAQSVFTDEALTHAATVSSTETGPAGATIISAGTTVYVPGGVAQSRRFSVSNYPTTITARAAMPFLDLQCLTDGVNNDNADGAGWGDQAIGAGAQTYCIAYVWDGATSPTATPTSASPTATTAATVTPTATPSPATPATVTPTATPSPATPATATPTATPSPATATTTAPPSATPSATATTPGTTTATATSGPAITASPASGISTTIDVMIPDGAGGWRLSSPAGQWTFLLTSDASKVSQTVRDGKLSLAPATYEVRFSGSTGNTMKASIADFTLLSAGACEKPDGADLTLTLVPEDFKKYGSIHICAFLAEVQSTAGVKKTFVKADDSTVVWRIEPSTPADLLVWDLKAESCEEFGGAACGAIAKGGAGTFSSASKEQYLIVTQSYKKDGESCSVTNTAEWSASNSTAKRQSVDASYICSGAPTMGWPLFGLFAAGVLAITLVARKKMQWPE